MDLPFGLAFDDVLLNPGESSVLPSQADTSSHVTGDIALAIPILSSRSPTRPAGSPIRQSIGAPKGKSNERSVMVTDG